MPAACLSDVTLIIGVLAGMLCGGAIGALFGLATKPPRKL